MLDTACIIGIVLLLLQAIDSRNITVNITVSHDAVSSGTAYNLIIDDTQIGFDIKSSSEWFTVLLGNVL